MTPFLFVYGTLMPSAKGQMGTPERERLATLARNLGPAATQGRLVDLGAYPGLVVAEGVLVHGTLLHLTEPAAILSWLDAYEGIAGVLSDEYVRLEREVIPADGQPTRAWVYVCRVVPPCARLIPSGRWPG
jgi:gamma-glutamylcyclotransferase (GGCT)/AIG2-like uncharacterized protein YtfP